MDVKSLYLAALLHDIGKFYQRADEEFRYTKHQEAGAIYLNRYLPKRLPDGERDEVIRLTANHHTPGTYHDYLLAVGDRLSSGEREEAEEGKGDAAREPLIAILSRITLPQREGADDAYHPLRVPSVERPPFPTRDKREALGEGSYRAYWNEFDSEMSKISDLGSREGLTSIYYTMQKYLSSVPSAAYYHRATVSLFDHARTTAAITTALAEEKPELDELKEVLAALTNYWKSGREDRILQKERFYLLAGDISGIQDFIYDIPMDGAARNLRGRSFLIAYLVEFLARYLVDEEGLFDASILLAGGGKFTLLLPASARERLEHYRGKIEREFYRAFGDRLRVFLAGITLRYGDFLPGRIAGKWDELGREIQLVKRKPWQSLLRVGRDLWEPFENEGTCPVCERWKAGAEGWCSFCRSILDLGVKAGQARILAEERTVPSGASIKTIDDFFSSFGRRVVLTESARPGCINYLLGGLDFLGAKCQGFFFAARSVPVEFDELAAKSRGLKTWGVLRGDVDYLGRIFREGLPNLTVSGLASLSRAIGEFFGVYFAGLLAPWQDRVYLIYAGGDDFCLVGSWSVLPQVVQKLRQDFSLYCGNNPALTFSAAIKLSIGVKFPLYRVADEAGKLLDEKAKAGGRNRVAFLDRAFTWDEFREVEEIKDEVVRIVSKGSRSLISILRFTGSSEDYRTAWRLAYQMARYRDSLSGGELRAVMEVLIDRLLPEGYRVYPFVHQVARWAELETRNGGNGD